MIRLRWRSRRLALPTFIIGSVLASTAPPVHAQEDPDYLGDLKTCRAIADDSERLACYDAKTGNIVTANEAGDVRLIDREDLRRTRRQLFGFSVPDIGILSDDRADGEKDKDALFVTTISSARQISGKGWRFTTAEGAVWEINNPPRRLAPIKPGDNVEFKKAALGFYFVRIAGQIGVKGKRVE